MSGGEQGCARDLAGADDLIALVCCDLGAIVRGRAVRSGELDESLRAGVGWVPANHALTPLGPVAEPNPFGSTGDLRLLPDAGTRVLVESDGAAGALELLLCDIVETDGQPWVCCPRYFLREALLELERELGARLVASFEHEFQLVAPDDADGAPSISSSEPAALPFSLEALRQAEPFPRRAMGALVQAGVRAGAHLRRVRAAPVRDPGGSRGGHRERRPRGGVEGGRARGRKASRERARASRR